MLIFLFEGAFRSSGWRFFGTSDPQQGGNEGKGGGRKLQRMAFAAFNMTSARNDS
jgi:hypothetical protein